ncbi:MAG: FN3 associated domain-containing protein [Treponema sp.]
MKKLYRFFAVASAAAFIVFAGCQNSLSDSGGGGAEGTKSGYGRLTVKAGGMTEEASAALEGCSISVSGVGMEDILISDAAGLSGGVTVERIPAGKNRVVSVRAKKTIKSVLANLDGVALRAVADINDDETRSVTIDLASSAVGSVFYELVKSGCDVSSLSADTVKSRLPSGVKAGLVNAKALAEDIKNGVSRPAAEYTLNGGAVTFTPNSTLSDAQIHVNDGASAALNGMTSGSQASITGVAPGTWTFYIIQHGSILYEKQVTVAEGQTADLGSITLKTPAPRLENADGSALTYYGLSAGERKTVYLNCRTVDGETPLDAEIYYTLDGSAPSSSSAKYTAAGIEVVIGTKLKAFAVKTGLQASEVVSYEFVPAELGKMHPASGAFSPVGEGNWKNEHWALGAHIAGGETTFALYSKNAEKILLEIYEDAYGKEAKYDYWLAKGSDDVWRAKLKSAPKGTIYAFRCWGANWAFTADWKRGGSGAGFISDVDDAGNRFNPNKVLFDPYAREMTHDKSNPAALGSKNGGMYGTGGEQFDGAARRNFDTGKYAPKAYIIEDSTSFGSKPQIPQEKAIIYEAHARGLTRHPSTANLTTILNGIDGFDAVVNVPEHLRGTYAGAAMMAPYLKALGVNTIELLPVHELDNDANPDDKAGGNYWGYMTYGFFAPDRRYSSDKSAGGPTKEFKEMVKAFHDAGMEVYLDVVFNHTGEGGVWSAAGDTAELTFMRGIDNGVYYSLTADKKFYWESTGCGNNMQCDNPVVRSFILDSLKYWIVEMGVDGFRFDLATVLGREKGSGGNWDYNKDSETLKQIVALGQAHNVEMIAESWDTGINSYQVGNFPAGWGGWNGRYRDVIRSYIGTGNRSVGGKGNVNDFINGDYNNFNKEGGPHKSVNFIVAHDGFTLADLCSYAGAGNAQNKNLHWPFGPSDGGDGDNNSLGFGTEQKDKRQAARNYIAVQMMSRGVPMIVWGDEFGRTQNGNNNPYNIDSVATWSNYAMINTASPHLIPTDGTGSAYHNNFGAFNNGKNRNGNFEFAKYMMNLRSGEPALNQADYTVSYDFKKEDGTSSLSESDKCVRLHIKGSAVSGGSDYLVFMNMHTASVNFTIPAAESGYKWVRLADTAHWAEKDFNCWTLDKVTACTGSYGVNPWSIVILKRAAESSLPEPVASPVISGTTPFSSSATVTITCATSGAEIHYTTDGSEPTASSQKYTAPFTLSDTKTVKAIAMKNGFMSGIVSKTFVKGTVAEVPKSGVMIQVFNWASAPRENTSQHNKWYEVVKDRSVDIKDTFAYAWFPPPGKCSSDSPEGYAPTELNDLNNYYGTKEELKAAITALSPCKAVADIVVNHRGGTTSWGDFTNPQWGENYYAICSDDEGFTASGADPMHNSPKRGAPDTGEKYSASRDLDHTNPVVQQGITDWMNTVLRPAGFYGWRYDFVKGYGGKYVGQYNRDSLAEFSVGEYWPTVGFNASNPSEWGNTIKNWVQSTEQDGGTRSRAFDFTLKGIMNTVFGYGDASHLTNKDIANSNYGLLADIASLMQSQPKDAVTFVDNHDTGSTQKHWFLDPDDVGTAYAFILTHPGFPCVAWQHYFTAEQSDHAGDTQYIGGATVSGTDNTYRQHIDYLINLRKTCGIGYDSYLEVLKAGNSVYAAKITGTSGELTVVIGTNGVYGPSGEGYDNKHAVYGGTNFTIWQKDTDGEYGKGTAKNYTVTNMPDWWGNQNAVQYVWIYGGTSGEHWIKASLDSSTHTLSFTTAWNFTKLITVRMDPAKNPPDWNAQWNQSQDLPISGNTAVFVQKP